MSQPCVVCGESVPLMQAWDQPVYCGDHIPEAEDENEAS